MKKDIATLDDIKMLVDTFYNHVKSDPTIGYIFLNVANVDWEHHLPKMYSFWETVLLGKISYKGNPMLKHIELSQKELLTPAHFDKWIEMWDTTIDSYFAGEKAEEAKLRAKTMKLLMLYKIGESQNKNFIQ